ncbi:MAG: Crp/Fnr family transcriptional regulator [Pseudomonadota bacterium]
MRQDQDGPEQNDLLAALPKNELAELLPHLELQEMSTEKDLYEFGRPLNYVYFPTSAIISLLYVMEDGATTELAVIGHEGMLGITLVFGDSLLGTPVVQNAGLGYRLKLSKLKEIFNRGGELQSLLLRYTQARLAHMAQSAVCGHHYSIDQKLCRWLLDRLDRLPSNILKTTQELIANMLGVRRESVTEAVGKLQDEGILQCTRGKITVLDRLGLESIAGECYKVAKNEYDHLFLKGARKMFPN